MIGDLTGALAPPIPSGGKLGGVNTDRRLLLGLAVAVIAGILAMHGFSVGHHSPTAPAGTSATHVHAHVGVDQPGCHAPDGSDTCTAATAMCLFVLLSLVLLVPGRGRAAWPWQPPWLRSPPSLPPVAAPGDIFGVSLTRLCISRT